MNRRQFLGTMAVVAGGVARGAPSKHKMPNLIFILTDDQRFDALGVVHPLIQTPTMDGLAKRGTLFRNAFVTTSICSPSRACCLTGRYGSANGVAGLGGGLDRDETTFAQSLKRAGYQTGYVGKWHLGRPATPKGAGFDVATWFRSNGPHYNRRVVEQGKKKVAKGYIESYLADRAIAFIEGAVRNDAPFVLHHATQIPHMDHRFSWPASDETKARYDVGKMPLPATWQDDLSGKPPYLKQARSRTKALSYGYDKAEAIRRHFRDYYAAITEMDGALGRIVAALDRLGLRDDTWLILMGDNGWFMGEHGFTSKVLAYEESIRVPFLVSGPGLEGEQRDELILNADIAPTFVDLAGLPIPSRVHGRSLVPLLRGEEVEWRKSILYEAPKPELGSWPLAAVRTGRWKYIQTFDIKAPSKLVFEELYDLQADPHEMTNLAGRPEHKATLQRLQAELARLREGIRGE